MTSIRKFPSYSTPENLVTNNCLLFVAYINEYNRRRFSRFIKNLLGDEIDDPDRFAGVEIQQQTRTRQSVLDGMILQRGFRIGIETKMPRALFDVDQLTRHARALAEVPDSVLIMLSPDDTGVPVIGVDGIIVVHRTFEAIITAARSCASDFDEGLLETIDAFEAFCSEQKLLSQDRRSIFVPPCGKSFEINEQRSLYFCDAGWQRRRCEYIGIYREKAVRLIGKIAKVVACDFDTDTGFEGDYGLTLEEKVRILGAARDAVEQNGWDINTGHKFYLCDAMFPTDFAKESSGGIQGHRYFDLKDIFGANYPLTAERVARELNGRTWR